MKRDTFAPWLNSTIPIPIPKSGESEGWYHAIDHGTYTENLYPHAVIDADVLAMVIADFKARKMLVPTDFDHRIIRAAFDGSFTGEANGWIDDLEDRGAGAGNGLWFHVKWLDTALDAIRSEKYKYLSPTFIWPLDPDAPLMRYTHLHSMSLVNDPYLPNQYALAASQMSEILNRKESKMHEKTKAFLNALLSALGFSGEYDAENFDHDGALGKLKDLSTPKVTEVTPAAVMSALGCDPKATVNEAIASIMALKNNPNIVSRDEHDKALAEVKKLRTDALILSAVHVDHKLSAEQVKEGSDWHTLAGTNPEAFALALTKVKPLAMSSGVADPSKGSNASKGVGLKEKYERLRDIGAIDPSLTFERYEKLAKPAKEAC